MPRTAPNHDAAMTDVTCPRDSGIALSKDLLIVLGVVGVLAFEFVYPWLMREGDSTRQAMAAGHLQTYAEAYESWARGHYDALETAAASGPVAVDRARLLADNVLDPAVHAENAWDQDTCAVVRQVGSGLVMLVTTQNGKAIGDAAGPDITSQIGYDAGFQQAATTPDRIQGGGGAWQYDPANYAAVAGSFADSACAPGDGSLVYRVRLRDGRALEHWLSTVPIEGTTTENRMQHDLDMSGNGIKLGD